MSKAQVKESLEQFELAQRTLELLKNLKIDWETDLEKMNFSLLRSKINYDLKNPYIDKINITKTPYFTGSEIDSIHMMKDSATIDLVEFIAKGNKIIPPLYIKPFEYDGETYSTKEVPELQLRDGGHRLFLSAFMGLEEIPIIVHDNIEKYYFPLSKWNYECVEESLIVKSKDGIHVFEFDFNRISICEGLFNKKIITVLKS